MRPTQSYQVHGMEEELCLVGRADEPHDVLETEVADGDPVNDLEEGLELDSRRNVVSNKF